MARRQCAFNSATALRRVFMPSNLGASDCLHVTRILVPALVTPSSSHQVRAYAYWDSNSARTAGTWGKPYANNVYRDPVLSTALGRKEKPADVHKPGPRVKTKMARLPRDEEIRQPYVHIQEEPNEAERVTRAGQEGRKGQEAQESEEGEEGEQVVETIEEKIFRRYGRLSDAMDLKHVLAGLNLKEQSLHVIAMPDTEGLVRWPVCRIVNKKEEYQKQQLEKEKQKKVKASSKQKEMEINWVVAPYDLEHKLKQLQKFLEKGYKVQVLLLKKAKANMKGKEAEGKALLEKIEQATAEVQGAKEWKKREGGLLGSMKIFLQGSPQGSSQPTEKKAARDSEEDGEISTA